MRKVAIVGSGIAGLVTAHGLLRAGCAVTLYSDRTPEQWLRGSRPTGTAARFSMALAYERELGLDHWSGPEIHGAHLIYCPVPKNRLATLTGRQQAPGLAVDVRLQCHRWMLDFEAKGGRLVIESVTVVRLDEIAAEHDLTLVAAGKADLAALFARDPQRSGFEAPQRHLAMLVVKGPPLTLDGVPFPAVRNNLLEGIGEAVWIPYHHRDVGPCWNLIFEARPGSAMDVFQDAKTGAEALECAQRVIHTLLPWEIEWARGMELADDMGWLVGKITPTVREPVARLPSGRIVGCVGDTAMLFDPLAAQGANNGVKMARHVVERVVARGDAPFDEAWMKETFDTFWTAHGRSAFELTALMLSPLNNAGKALLISQYGSDGVARDGKQALADAFAHAFADPREMVAMLGDFPATQGFIARSTGRPWWLAAAGGLVGILRSQVRQLFGLEPGHPRS